MVVLMFPVPLVKIGLNGKNSTYGVCLPQIAQGHFIAEVTADKTTNFWLGYCPGEERETGFQ